MYVLIHVLSLHTICPYNTTLDQTLSINTQGHMYLHRHAHPEQTHDDQRLSLLKTGDKYQLFTGNTMDWPLVYQVPHCSCTNSSDYTNTNSVKPLTFCVFSIIIIQYETMNFTAHE